MGLLILIVICCLLAFYLPVLIGVISGKNKKTVVLPSGHDKKNVETKLKEVEELLRKEIITKEEYDRKRADIIEKMQ